jgi:heme exporter protein D
MDLGPHAFFIVAAYAVTAAIVGGLVMHAVLDHRMQQRALAALEGRGVRRRSDRPPPRASANAAGEAGRGQAIDV